MAPPIYVGKAQQPASISSWFGSWLGGTPAYVGTGQPVTKTSMFGPAAPAYKPAPTAVADDVSAEQCTPAPFAIVIPRSLADPQS